MTGANGFERMVEQHLAFAHDREDVFLRHQPLGNARRVRRKFQVRPIDQIVNGHESVEIHRTVDLIQIVALEREVTQQEGGDVFRTIERSFQSHGRAVAPLRELAFDRAQQVVHFFVVDEQIAVARDAELPGAFHLHAAEQLRDEGRNHRRQEHEVGLARLVRGSAAGE